MGKETKIGVSLILILLCVLAGVMAMRMTRSKEKNLVAAITSPEAPRPEPKPEPKPEPFRRPSPTTLLPARDLSKHSSGWSLASDSSSRPTMPPPKPASTSFMPDPSLAASRPPMPRDGLSPTTPPGPPSPSLAGPSGPPGSSMTLASSRLPEPAPMGPRPGEPNPLRGANTLSISVAQADPPAPPGPHHGPRYGGASYGSMNPPPMTYASGRRDYGGPPEPPPTVRNVALPAADPIPERRPMERAQPGGTYKVQPGDNYWRISEKLYGTGAYFKALAEHNREQNLRDDRLQPGTVIAAPEVPVLEKKYASLCPKSNHKLPGGSRFAQVSSHGRMAGRRTYKVEAGDTLYDIAKHELGDPSRWGEIYQLNRDLLGEDYDYLPKGLELALPDGPRRDTLTQRPDDGFRR